MQRSRLMKTFLLLILIFESGAILSFSSAVDATLSPPPTPPYTLTVPRVNEITYMISAKSVNASWITLDFSIPKTWMPDLYIQTKAILTHGATSVMNYTDRENLRMRLYNADLKPGEYITANVTFYSLKYKLEYSTHQPLTALGYPAQYTVYTEPENYIESNNSLIMNKALALVGNRTNPFRIAEQMYDFALSYITYKPQSGIRGAAWAIQNGSGDCTEFGSLFVALMRAVGVPARTVIGHVASELSSGGVANASLSWVDSPHLWAEFFAEGYGWVPVDPTFGRNDTERHFGTTWANCLPIMKGPTMEDPTDSLVNIRYPAETQIEYSSQLIVTPIASPLFEDKAIQDFISANEQTNIARRVAAKAYDYSFNASDSHPFLDRAFNSLVNASIAIQDGNPLSREYSLAASSYATQTLDMISTLVMDEARVSIDKAWKDFRILGAISGENYLRMAKTSQENNNPAEVVQNAYFARATADQAPSIVIFLGPVLLCVFTVLMISRKNRDHT